MKNKFNHINVFFAIISVMAALAISSCEVEVDASKLPSNGNKIVVNSMISPERDTIEVGVSLSKPIIGFTYYNADPDADIITNAEVTISDEISSAQLIYNNVLKKYILPKNQFPIVDGVTYYLNVKIPTREISCVRSYLARNFCPKCSSSNCISVLDKVYPSQPVNFPIFL